MAVKKKLGSVKRFGARYGRRAKHKLAEIEKIQKGKHRCPYCHSMKAKRLAAGIWYCRKCKAKFTGKAYTIKEVIVAEEMLKKEEVKGET